MQTFDDPSKILGSTRLVDRFVSYVQVDTQSDEEAASCPSTAKQLDLARQLVDELNELGLDDVTLDGNGYVLAELKGNREGVLGLIAHVDTAPAFSGTGVKPRLHESYDGSPIRLEADVVIDPADSPDLLSCKGDTIITSDGTTLLGADDKAGIAAIMGALEMLVRHRDLPRPTIRVCFNPDEEIGRGAHKFPLERFDAPVAFTVDGGFPCELNVETFSADKATVVFRGVAVHPGEAKGKLVNALTYLGKFLDRLPMAETPECTEERQGFFHPTDVSGDAAACKLNLILRDFDEQVLQKRGERVRAIAQALRAEEPRLQVEVEITQQYRNMHDELSKRPEIAERMVAAARAAGLDPEISPIRGGTDGSQLTAMGLPTPNIFAGGVNFHGPTEWVSTRAIALSTCVLLNLVQIYAEAAG
jgi:tripeptide aminopeptidase